MPENTFQTKPARVKAGSAHDGVAAGGLHLRLLRELAIHDGSSFRT